MADNKRAMAYYLPEDMIRWVNMQAEREHRPRSYIVERAISRERAAIEAAARGES